jgi:hypothetical protein
MRSASNCFTTASVSLLAIQLAGVNAISNSNSNTVNTVPSPSLIPAGNVPSFLTRDGIQMSNHADADSKTSSSSPSSSMTTDSIADITLSDQEHTHHHPRDPSVPLHAQFSGLELSSLWDDDELEQYKNKLLVHLGELSSRGTIRETDHVMTLSHDSIITDSDSSISSWENAMESRQYKQEDSSSSDSTSAPPKSAAESLIEVVETGNMVSVLKGMGQGNEGNHNEGSDSNANSVTTQTNTNADGTTVTDGTAVSTSLTVGNHNGNPSSDHNNKPSSADTEKLKAWANGASTGNNVHKTQKLVTEIAHGLKAADDMSFALLEKTLVN